MSFIKKRGGNWHYYWREGGKQHAKSLGTDNKQVAEIIKGDEDRRRFLGKHNLPDDKKTWLSFKAEYLRRYTGSTLALYNDACRRFEAIARPTILASFTPEDAKRFVSNLNESTSEKTGETLSPATINITITNLKAMFNDAVKMGFIVRSPFQSIQKIRVVKRLPKFLTKDQVATLLETAKSSDHPDLYLMTLFFVYTGVRLSALINLQWDNVHHDRLYLRETESHKPKDREEIVIPLHPSIVEALKTREKASKYIFPGMDGVRCKYSVERLFNRLYKKTGIKESGVHILRHTFATHAATIMSTGDLQKILGHSDIRTTLIYAHSTRDGMDRIKSLNF